jgi:5,10-methylenetetrahydromethanopterin reductase
MKDVRIGLMASDGAGQTLEQSLAEIRETEEAGFATAWLPNIFGFDALTLAALAGGQTSRIEIGTAVVPTFSRHPFYMAQQAATTQAALGGRFTLGLGPSHKIVIESMMGLSYEKPARHVREYVTVLQQLLEKGQAAFEGETYRVNGGLQAACGKPPQVLIGALGPIMRKIAGTLSAGTITWMTGPRTIEQEVGPGVRAAAEQAGRPAPRIVAGIPVCVTEDADGAREKAARVFAMYGSLPSYRAMMDLEGVAGPEGIALVGDEKAIEAGIRGFVEAGITDFNAAPFPHGDDSKASVERTRSVLSQLARA